MLKYKNILNCDLKKSESKDKCIKKFKNMEDMNNFFIEQERKGVDVSLKPLGNKRFLVKKRSLIDEDYERAIEKMERGIYKTERSREE